MFRIFEDSDPNPAIHLKQPFPSDGQNFRVSPPLLLQCFSGQSLPALSNVATGDGFLERFESHLPEIR